MAIVEQIEKDLVAAMKAKEAAQALSPSHGESGLNE